MTKKEKRRQYTFVIKELVSREIKRKYARSYLGIAWSVLNPLLSMIVITLIFSHMFHRAIENYPVYYLTGSVIWHMFTSGTNAAMTTLVDNKNMLIKVRLPMEIFVLARICTVDSLYWNFDCISDSNYMECVAVSAYYLFCIVIFNRSCVYIIYCLCIFW